MQIGELNRRVDIMRATITRDAFGGEISTWSVLGSVWANIRPGVARENLVNEQVQGFQEAVITIRYRSDITIKDRVRYQDKYYEIVGVKDIDTGHFWTEITAKEIIDGIQR